MLSHSVMSNSLHSQGCSPPGSSVHGDSPGKNTGVGSHALLQGIFPTQESNWGLLYCGRILYQLSYQGSLFDIPECFIIKKKNSVGQIALAIDKTFSTWYLLVWRDIIVPIHDPRYFHRAIKLSVNVNKYFLIFLMLLFLKFSSLTYYTEKIASSVQSRREL